VAGALGRPSFSPVITTREPPVGSAQKSFVEQSDDPDSGLMLRVRDGDREAFQVLYEKYVQAMIRFAANFIGTRARAEELAQEVFLQVYRARDRYEPRAKFSTWLYTIAHNLCLNEVRRFEYRGKLESLDRDDTDPDRPPRPELADTAALDGESTLATKEVEQRIRELVASLPESQRTALILSRSESLRYQEIGEILSCSEQAVKSLIFRATQRLKEGLRGYVEEPE
jgi:RNA polymerase sigma-70 factor (ECF subfamily)